MVLRETALLIARSAGSSEGRFLTFLTAGSGKVRLYYRLFPRRMKREYFDLLQSGELLYAPSTEAAPGRIHSFDCEHSWPALRRDFSRLVHALHFAAIAESFVGECEPAPEVFAILTSFLGHLERPCEPRALRMVYELQILRAAGFAPSLSHCVFCRSVIAARDATFSPANGGVVCSRCRKNRKEPGRRLSPGAVTFMRRALDLPLQHAARLRLGAGLREELSALIEGLLEHVLEERPCSSVFLQGDALRLF